MKGISDKSILSSREKSKSVYEASQRVIPGGVNSPVRVFNGLDIVPLVVDKGEGNLLYDVDGHSYIDYCLSWGSLPLGHAHPDIVKAVCARMSLGSSFGAITPSEEALASAIIKQMPWLEKMRFVSSGTEATMSALRLARAITGKRKIVKFIGNYHGHHDQLLTEAGSGLLFLNPQASSKGVPAEMICHTFSLPYNDVDALYRLFEKEKEIAAVIFEPIAANMGVIPTHPDFLRVLCTETKRIGALLIADEVITGFRVASNGAQGLYGFEADLTCLSKIIGGGFPVGAFGGKSAIMDQLAPLGEVYQAGTLSGNPVAMTAGLVVMEHLAREGFYKDLQEKTQRLLNPIQEEIIRRDLPCCLNQVGSMFTLFFGPRVVKSKGDLKAIDLQQFKKFFQFLFERGIYFSPSQYEACFLSAAHPIEHLDYTRDTILDFFRRKL